MLDPLAFQACFTDWMTALMNRHGLISIPIDHPALKPIAIDRKTQRGSAWHSVGHSPLHTVSAWSVENHLTLGHVATEARSNEITAIPELLKLLDLDGAVVTIDAMGCQKDIAAGIEREGGEYVLAVKETSRISTRTSSGRSKKPWSTASPESTWVRPRNYVGFDGPLG